VIEQHDPQRRSFLRGQTAPKSRDRANELDYDRLRSLFLRTVEVAESQKEHSIHSYHIGIAWSTTGAGGSARVVSDLSQYLPAKGVLFSGAVAFPEDVSELTSGAIECFAPASAGAISRLLGARRTIVRGIARTKPDLVASHFAFFAATALDRIGRLPHVVHFHGPWAAESLQEGSSKFAAQGKLQIERTVYRTADRVIVLSQAFADLVRKDYGVPQEKIRIVPGAVDVRRFNVGQTPQEAREALGWPADRKILVAVRRLVSRMGLDNLIAAVAALRKVHPDVRLYIVGKGRLREELEAKVAALNLQDYVVFQGFVSDEQLPLVYRAADLSVVPTIALEGFGLVAAESLAAGTPCIVTPIGGLPEIVSRLSPNLIFRSTKADDMVEGIAPILSGALTLPTAARCLEYVSANFNVQRMAGRVADVYREALGASH
jgi:glycosyltransferase involved in cell wall biosynthesis